MALKYVVRLTQEERKALRTLVVKGQVAGYKTKHANILLKADADGASWTDERIAEAFGVHRNSVGSIRKTFVEKGLEAAVGRKKRCRPGRSPKLDAQAHRQLIALCEGPPPEGRGRWTLRLLGSKLVELELVDSISPETVRKVLKKTT
jgi:transposase